MAIFSVDEKAGTLRWEMRPENVVPLMGSNRPETPQNNDGNCDPKEPCLTTPDDDVFSAPDGQVYFVMQSASTVISWEMVSTIVKKAKLYCVSMPA